MVTDKLEGSSEHRTYQEGILKKTKEVAVISFSTNFPLFPIFWFTDI